MKTCLRLGAVLALMLCSTFTVDSVSAVVNEFNVGCKVGRTSNVSLPPGWTQGLEWQKEYYDTDEMHDAVTNPERIYCVADGRYQIIAIVGVGDMLVDESITLSVAINNWVTPESGGIWATQGYSTAVGNYMFQCSGQIDLVAGDYVKLYIKNDTPTNITIYGSTTNFGLHRIGIGGESMEMSVAFPPAVYGVAIGLVLILINLKAKMALLWLGAAVCFIGVFFDPALHDTYYQAAAVVVILACLVAGFFGYKNKRATLG